MTSPLRQPGLARDRVKPSMDHFNKTTRAPRTLSDVDQDGSIGLSRLGQIAKEHSPAEFMAAFPTPALILGPYSTERSPDADPTRRTKQFKTFKASSVETLRYRDKVIFVAKRSGRPFPDSIFVGRTPTNDVVLDVQSVSKLHGRFEEQGGTWYFTDTDSALGTWSTASASSLEAASPSTPQTGFASARIWWPCSFSREASTNTRSVIPEPAAELLFPPAIRSARLVGARYRRAPD